MGAVSALINKVPKLPHTYKYWWSRLSSVFKPKTLREFPMAMLSPVSCDVLIACDERNREFLPETLRSILNQTNATVTSHLCFDGGAPDLTELRQAFPEVRYYETPQIVGPFRIANEMIPYCQHDFVAIQDADDIAMPTRLAWSINELQRSKNDFFGGYMEQFCDYRYRDANTLTKSRLKPWHCSGTQWPVCPEGVLINGTLVFRRQRFVELEGYGDLRCSGDMDFCNRLNFHQARISLSGKIVALRRLHARSLTADEFAPGTRLRNEIDALVINRLDRLRQGQETVTSLGALSAHLANPVIKPLY